MFHELRLRHVAPALAGAALLAGCGDSGRIPSLAGPQASSEASAALLENGELKSEFGGPAMPFADAEVFFEFNSTDNDLGFHLFLDGEEWNRVVVHGPDEGRLIDFKARNELKELGITELRFESAEPSPGEVLQLFAPGSYSFFGKTVDGTVLQASRTLSHALPPAADLTPREGDVVEPGGLVIRWNPIGGLRGYEVILGNEDTGHSMSVELPGDATSVAVPDEFLMSGATYKAEVLTIGMNGNKTIVENTFFTR